MTFLSEDLIAPGGPSLPVWGYLSAIIIAIVTIMPAIYTTRKEAREGRSKAEEAVANTRNISNGFAKGVNVKLDELLIITNHNAEQLNKHLAWHLEQENYREREDYHYPDRSSRVDVDRREGQGRQGSPHAD